MKINLLTQIAPENKLLYRLEREIKNTDKAFIAVSFIQRGGMEQMFKMLKKILEIKKEVIIYTSGYLRITDPEALEDLLSIKPSAYLHNSL